MIRHRRAERHVGSLLRALPVPDHADDFFDRLRAQLHAESYSSDTSDGADVAITDVFHLDRGLWYDPFRLQADDPGLDVVCLTTEAAVPATGQVLLTFDADRTWTGAIGDSPPVVVQDLRRHGR